MSIHVVVRERGAFLRAIPLVQPVVVGRNPLSDIVVLDPKVSRKHVQISPASEGGEGASIVDLKSRHGTRLDGHRVTEGQAKIGSLVQIGEAVEITLARAADGDILLRSPGGLPETAISPRADRRLQLLYTISAAIAELKTVEGVSERMLAAVCESVAADVATLDVLGEGANIKRSHQFPPALGASRRHIPPALLSTVVANRERVITGRGSAMAVPLIAAGGVSAVLYVERREADRGFGEEDLENLTAIGVLLAAALAQATQFERVRMAAAAARPPTPEIVGTSERIASLRAEIARVARSEASVIVHGESGSGKELVAHRLHAESRRAEGPFVAVNCGAIPDNLFEAEMFGAERGAFTGAVEARAGFFLRAHRGTIFLDEVAELTPLAQTKLLRVLETGTVLRLGAKREEPADVRLVAASHKRLRDEVRRGAFREDLCFRLSVVELTVPPLRERPEDAPLLAALFADRIAGRDAVEPPRFTQAAIDALASYRWPGNVRELRNEVERAMVVREANEIDRRHFSDRVRGEEDAPRSLPGEVARSLRERFARLDREEKELVLQAMAEGEGNVSRAARLLGISRVMVKRRLDRYAEGDRDGE